MLCLSPPAETKQKSEEANMQDVFFVLSKSRFGTVIVELKLA